MNFCPWYPLVHASEHAPAEPGVFQVRIPEGLIDYPKGKSAMIHYGHGPDVREAARAFAALHPGVGWLCRHAVDMTPRERQLGLASAFEALVTTFVRRFGREPGLPPGGAAARNQDA